MRVEQNNPVLLLIDGHVMGDERMRSAMARPRDRRKEAGRSAWRYEVTITA